MIVELVILLVLTALILYLSHRNGVLTIERDRLRDDLSEARYDRQVADERHKNLVARIVAEIPE